MCLTRLQGAQAATGTFAHFFQLLHIYSDARAIFVLRFHIFTICILHEMNECQKTSHNKLLFLILDRQIKNRYRKNGREADNENIGYRGCRLCIAEFFDFFSIVRGIETECRNGVANAPFVHIISLLPQLWKISIDFLLEYALSDLRKCMVSLLSLTRALSTLQIVSRFERYLLANGNTTESFSFKRQTANRQIVHFVYSIYR